MSRQNKMPGHQIHILVRFQDPVQIMVQKEFGECWICLNILFWQDWVKKKTEKNEKPFPAFCRDSQIPIIFCNWSTTGGMRWPNVNIQWNNIYLTGFKQKNAKSLIISVLIFRCPGRTHITNLTRMPLYWAYGWEWDWISVWCEVLIHITEILTSQGCEQWAPPSYYCSWHLSWFGYKWISQYVRIKQIWYSLAVNKSKI